MADLSGKRAHVTGGGRGLGEAIARLFVERGAQVVLSDMDGDAAERVAADIGDGATAVACDVTRAQELEAAIEATVSALGGLDVMVNNAGIEIVKPALEFTEEEFDRIFAVNVKGVWLGTKAAAPALMESGGGAIVNMASVAGHGGAALFSVYCATKGAVVRFTEGVAHELRAAGIRVNAVCPAFIDTAMVERLIPIVQAAVPIPVEELVAMRQGRIGTPAEVAETVAFLASDEASFITGAHYLLDNGLTSSCI